MLRNWIPLTLSIIMFCLAFLNTPPSQARNFKNAYISFDMQDSWKCSLEQTEWVCRSEDPQQAKEAVIILTAKEKGPTDTTQIYESHMNNPINTISKTGAPITSIVKYKAQTKIINDQSWLDGLHQDSEVQNYFTRYLATIKDQISILVTFSAHKKYYANHSSNFDQTIRSLRVVATKDILSQRELGPISGANERLGSGISNHIPDILAPDEEIESKGKKSIFKNDLFLGFVLFLIAVLIYLGLKIYQKSGK